MDERTLRRFMSKVSIGHAGGCWTWTGHVDAAGYGAFRLERGASIRPHRHSYEHFICAIGAGLTIDHLCRNRACVNPTHLEPVTMRENVLRGTGVAAMHHRKTHCKNGHPLSGDNLKIGATNGQRLCRECMRIYGRRRRRHPITQPEM